MTTVRVQVVRPSMFALLATFAFAFATAFATAFGAAHGQELAVDPDSELRDYDQAREDYSEFWERALSPAAGTYEDLIAQAAALIHGDAKGAAEARVLLEDAIAARANAPLAFFWLGVLEKTVGDYPSCASALDSARRLDPSFRAPPNSSRQPDAWQLDYDLGLCLALAGDYSSALERFDAIMTTHPSCTVKRRAANCYHWHVPWRVGETLMALGRLEESIAVLRTSDSSSTDVLYTLAIALERDEQAAASKEALDRAVASDQSLRSLADDDRLYIPATDEFYYRGRARIARGEMAHARLFFAAFLQAAPASPWRERAAAQLSRLEAKTSIPLEVGGELGISTATKAVAASRAAFEKCAEGFPNQLFDVLVTQRVVDAQRRGKTDSVRSVSVRHHDPLAKKRLSTDIIEVTTCLRRVGDAMGLSAAKGAVGTTSYVRFSVVGR